MLDFSNEGCLGHGLVHLLVSGAADLGFVWDSHLPGWK